MSIRVVSAVCVCLLFIFIFCSLSPDVHGATLVVDDDSGSWADYSTIQSAVDNASADDTIRVYAGMYLESVNVSERVRIEGNGSNASVVDSEGADFTFEINKNRIELVRLGITNSSSTNRDAGIYIYDRKKTRIEECHIYDHRENGVYIYGGETTSILNTTITSNSWRALYAESTLGLTIDNCSIVDHSSYSIYIFDSNETLIKGSSFIRNSMSLWGRDSAGVVVEDCEFADHHSDALYFDESTDVEVRKCNFNNVSNGIYSQRSHIDIVADCIFDGCRDRSLHIYQGSFDKIHNCTINATDDMALYLYRSGAVEISNCTIDSSTSYGIYLRYCDGSVITNCTIKDNARHGIYNIESDDVDYWDLDLTGNGHGGMYILESMNISIGHVTMDEGLTLFGEIIDEYRSHTVKDVTVQGVDLQFLLDQTDMTIDSNITQAIAINCTNITFEDLDLSGVSTGVQIIHSNNVSLVDSTLDCLFKGFFMDESMDTTIDGCSMNGSAFYGIDIFRSHHSTIRNTTVSWFGDNGIWSRYGSTNVTIEGCWVHNNSEYGIELNDQTVGTGIGDNIIKDTVVENCTKTGIYIDAFDNELSDLIVRNNGGNGILLEGIGHHVTNCSLHDNAGKGIYLNGADDGFIEDCNVSGNDTALYMDNCLNFTVVDSKLDGGFFVRYSDHEPYYDHVIDNCTVWGRDLLFFEHDDNLTIDADDRQIYIVHSSNITVRGANVTDRQFGLIIVSSEQITVHNSTYFNCSEGGAYVLSSDNIEFDNCSMYNNTNNGLRMLGSDHSIVKRSEFFRNEDAGISMYRDHQDAQISDCTLRANQYGIAISNSVGSRIENCSVFRNSDYGIRLGWETESTVISDCRIYNDTIGVIFYDDSESNTIENCTIWNNSISGIDFEEDPSGNRVDNCSISNNTVGIRLNYHSWSWTQTGVNTVQNCSIFNNTNGIEIGDYDDFLFIGCSIQRNLADGIKIVNDWYNSTKYGCTFIECIVSDNGADGIDFTKGHSYNITNCSIFNNKGIGVDLNGSYNRILFNDIFNNGVNVKVHQWQTGNEIHHNNFVNWTNGTQAIDNGYNNTWDDGDSEGNYWSDYNGTDGNSDGVGDTPYEIGGDADAEDRYPLMRAVNTSAPERIPELVVMIPSIAMVIIIAVIRRRYR